MTTQMTEAVEVSNPLEKLVAESGLAPAKGQYILTQFQDYFKIAAEWEHLAKSINVTSADQVEDMKMAREGRLFLKAKRIAVENTRKELKEQSLREGKAIDGIANVLKAVLTPIEEYLDSQEHFVENQELKRVAAMVESRRIELVGVGLNPALYNLALMSEPEFMGILEAERRRKSDEAAARQKADEERIAREEESKRVREENDRLRAEMAEKERIMREERAAVEEQNRKERAAAEARATAERELAQKRIEEERMERERLEAELWEKEQAEHRELERQKFEAKAKAEVEAAERRAQEVAEQKAAQAPDREKILAFAAELRSLQFPDVASPEAQDVMVSIRSMIDRTVRGIEELAEML